MADAMAYYHALRMDSDTTETEKFVRTFDRFFDMLNTRCLEEGVQKIKPDLHPYRSSDDTRLKVSCTVMVFLIIITLDIVARKRLSWVPQRVEDQCGASSGGLYTG